MTGWIVAAGIYFLYQSHLADDRLTGPGSIVQCGHPNGDVALITYPDDWDQQFAADPAIMEIDWSTGLERDGEIHLPDGRIMIDAVPLAPPRPAYPAWAMATATEGICEIKFTVLSSGTAGNIRAACSNPIFIQPARNAVAASRFKPRTLDGTPYDRHNVVYPMQFCLSS
ncbi:MAG: energy transducer TonB [Hyphomonas sp.]|uniref:energy transducer TonB n=1 Tax=Hyphomonas sp. TaxID=87 RepID=UPI00352942A9